MAVKMNLWSMTLLPGEKKPMYVRRDFQITNAALGEELADENGRSVVKITHNPIPASAFDSDDEYDSEIDSDFDDEEDDVDDEDLDEEDAEAKKKVKQVAKEALKGLEDADMADDDEDDEDFGAEDDDEEDDEDDEDDFDSDDEEPVETSVLCSLIAGKVEQAQLNIVLVEGEVVMFEATGKNVVHLIGNYIDQFPDVDSDEESEFDSDDSEFDDYSALYGSDDDEEGPEIEEIEEEEEVEVKPKKAVKAAPAKEAAAPGAATPVASQKRKADAVESPAAPAASTEGLSKAQKKKLAKKAKLEAEAPAAAAAPAAAEKPKAKAQAAPQKRTTASGLIIEDITVGTGPVAKGGKRLGMRYIGKLTSGKQFDANTAGKPFSFVLGRGEVIKGWDEGLVGMAVGGERRLTIPPQLAYGKRASGPIPANSTLKFDVKLVSIN